MQTKKKVWVGAYQKFKPKIERSRVFSADKSLAFKLRKWALKLYIYLYALCLLADDTIRMRVVGGSEAPADKYPSVASIVKSGISGAIQICGGVIITQRHILTAAHCFK